jgi:hypothetical protein
VTRAETLAADGCPHGIEIAGRLRMNRVLKVCFLLALGTRLLAADPVMFRGGPAHLGVYGSHDGWLRALDLSTGHL